MVTTLVRKETGYLGLERTKDMCKGVFLNFSTWIQKEYSSELFKLRPGYRKGEIFQT